jgi:mono/diheme cytochrome c family protein
MIRSFLFAALTAALTVGGPARAAVTPAEVLATYTTQAGGAPQPARGQQLFTTRHGREWSCSSCHGATPTQVGRHVVTGKAIAPLAPAFNAERFTDTTKVEKWFRRNCNDIVGRECSVAEKADVLAWLMTLKL